MNPNPNPYVDVKFELNGRAPVSPTIPADHGYLLYSALSKAVPEIHGNDDVAIHPISGRRASNGKMSLTEYSSLCVRMPYEPTEQRMQLVQASGCSLSIGGGTIMLGPVSVSMLRPAEMLRSRIVTIKNFADDVQDFKKAVRRQLKSLNVSDDVTVSVEKRRIVRVRRRQIVGFGVQLGGLSPEESIEIQKHGIGGRRRMGCGVFCPTRKEQ